jgi:uncharacterized repeat protein (TIGR01451 family)
LIVIFWLAVLAFVALPALPASADTPSADLATTMEATGNAIFGDYVSFTATVTNEGPNHAEDVVVSDNFLPATFAGVSASAPSGASCTGPPVGGIGTITCTTRVLAPGRAMKITVRLRSRALHNQLLSNAANAASSTYDPNTGNNAASVTLRG